VKGFSRWKEEEFHGMDASRFEPSVLALRHFGNAILGDARRTKRLVKSGELLMASPQGTLPQKLSDRANLVGLYRLVDCPRVTHAAVLEPHCQQTLMAMRGHGGVVLLVHDTTELDFTHVSAPAGGGGPGQIGNGGGRGYLCHNTLAVAPTPGGGRRVLGLAGRVLHRRRVVPRGETPSAKRAHPARESRLWARGCDAVGPAPAGRLWVDVCDRGADTIEFIEHEVAHGRHFVARVAKDRNLDGDDHFGAGGDRIHPTASCSPTPPTSRSCAPAPGRCRRRRASARRARRRSPSRRRRCGCGPGASPAGSAGARR
jgi:hypothetical protein